MFGREVVVTGVGLVTPLGIGVEENWANLRALKTGIAQNPQKAGPHRFGCAGRVMRFELPSIPPALSAQVKFLNRGALLGLAAAYEAIAPLRVPIESIPPGRRALYVASGDFSTIGYEYLYPATEEQTTRRWENVDTKKLNENALTMADPFFLLKSINNNLFSFLSAYHEFRGSSTSLATLSPQGGQALELGYRSVQSGKADVALSVGYGNWIDEIPLYELDGLGLLSRCEDGVGSFRPFDRSRDGFIPGEGGAAILLEAAEVAQEHGSTILGKLRGCGNCIEFVEGGGFSVPPKVTERCMRSALADARCDIDDLAFIVGHGSGTKKGDRSELYSMLAMMGSAGVPICALKPYTGHMGAASDLCEVILGLKAARLGTVPATLNFRQAEEQFSGLAIAGVHRPCAQESFLSVSYGLGGQSCALVISVERRASVA